MDIMETARRYRTDSEINLYSACHAPHDESIWKFNRKKFTGDGQTTYSMKQRQNTALTDNLQKLLIDTTPTPEINLHTACHALHDESTRKFYRK